MTPLAQHPTAEQMQREIATKNAIATHAKAAYEPLGLLKAALLFAWYTFLFLLGYGFSELIWYVGRLLTLAR